MVEMRRLSMPFRPVTAVPVGRRAVFCVSHTAFAALCLWTRILAPQQDWRKVDCRCSFALFRQFHTGTDTRTL